MGLLIIKVDSEMYLLRLLKEINITVKFGQERLLL